MKQFLAIIIFMATAFVAQSQVGSFSTLTVSQRLYLAGHQVKGVTNTAEANTPDSLVSAAAVHAYVLAHSSGYWTDRGSNTISNNNTSNVGIGTTTPTALLDVAGTFRMHDGTEANGYVLTSDASGNATWQAAGGGGSITDGSGTTANGTAVDLGGSLTTDANILTQAHDFYIRDNTSASALRILDTDSYLGDVAGSSNGTLVHAHDNGNQIMLTNTANTALVGINTTSPSVALTVVGAIYNSSNTYSDGLLSLTEDGNFKVGDFNGDVNGNNFQLHDGSSTAYYDNNAHNISVGINTTTPTVALDVVGDVQLNNGGSNSGFNTTASSGLTAMGDRNGNGSGTDIEVWDNGQYIAMSAGLGVIISNSLSIGTTATPTQALDVNGNAQVSGYTITPPEYLTPANGAEIAPTHGWVIINPAGSLTSLTIDLPSSPVDGQTVTYSFSQTIVTLTYSGGTVDHAPTTPAGGDKVTLGYSSAAGKWFNK